MESTYIIYDQCQGANSYSAELYELKVIQFPHPILIILTPVESDLLLGSWVIFLWVWCKPKRKINIDIGRKKHETKHNNEISYNEQLTCRCLWLLPPLEAP